MIRWFFLLAILTLTLCESSSAGVTRFVPRSFLTQKVYRTYQQSSDPSPKTTNNACILQIAAAEYAHGIPRNLMQAVAKVESGRQTRTGDVEPWPWTVNAEGKGYFYDTKEEAITGVKELQSQGINSIDVGCMQVNLYHHPDAFGNLEAAFDPTHNVHYAAGFLKKLNTKHQNWEKAISHYHSATPEKHIPYHGKVMAEWNQKKSTSLPHSQARNSNSNYGAHSFARSKRKTVRPHVSTTPSVILASANRSQVHKVTRSQEKNINFSGESEITTQAIKRTSVIYR